MEPTSSESSITALQDKLDMLWEQYLAALDTYTAAQQVLSKTLASGYFSLAQANARRTGGRRYGQDWYDERSKATARARIAPVKGVLDFELKLTEVPVYLKPEPTDVEVEKPSHRTRYEVRYDPGADTVFEMRSDALPTPSPTPEPEKEKSEIDQALSHKQQPDPATWYGLFVSPSLRHSQQIFRSALYQQGEVESGSDGSPVATAINACRLLRSLEVQIRAVRKALRKAGGSSTLRPPG